MNSDAMPLVQTARTSPGATLMITIPPRDAPHVIQRIPYVVIGDANWFATFSTDERDKPLGQFHLDQVIIRFACRRYSTPLGGCAGVRAGEVAALWVLVCHLVSVTLSVDTRCHDTTL